MRFTFLSLLLVTSASAATVDHTTREIRFKVVYASVTDGAHANLKHMAAKTGGDAAAPARAKAGTYDFLQMKLGEIRGYTTHFDLYGLRFDALNAEARARVLQGVDAVVFIASAAPASQKDNQKSFATLKKAVASQGFALEKLPFVLQLDADAVEAPVPMEAVRETLGLPATTTGVHATPSTGVGVFETLKAIAKKALVELKNSQAPADAGAR